jgi:hypothetical protein
VTGPHDEAWASAVARSRGLEIDAADAEQLAGLVAPILADFAQIAGELSADDDMYEFRRLLAQEGKRG